MRPIRRRFTIALTLACLAGLASATADSVTPGSGAFGTEITVSGSGFGTKRPDARLVPVAGGKARKLAVLGFSDTQVVVRVGAAAAGAYDVVVDPRDRSLPDSVAASGFTVVLASAAVLTPASALPNTEVVLTANGLGTKKGRVAVGGVPAKVLTWDGASVRFRLGRKTRTGRQDVVVQTSAGSATFASAIDVSAGGGGFDGPIAGNPWSGAKPGMSYRIDGAFDSIDSAPPVHEPLAIGATDTRISSLRSGFRTVEIHLDRSVAPPDANGSKRLGAPKARMSLRLADGKKWATSSDPSARDLLPGAAIDLSFSGEFFGGFAGKFSATLVLVQGTGAATVEITEGFFWVTPK